MYVGVSMFGIQYTVLQSAVGRLLHYTGTTSTTFGAGPPPQRRRVHMKKRNSDKVGNSAAYCTDLVHHCQDGPYLSLTLSMKSENAPLSYSRPVASLPPRQISFRASSANTLTYGSAGTRSLRFSVYVRTYFACLEERGIRTTGSANVSQPAEAAGNLRVPEADLDPMMSDDSHAPKRS